jgi:hypothetical protein
MTHEDIAVARYPSAYAVYKTAMHETGRAEPIEPAAWLIKSFQGLGSTVLGERCFKGSRLGRTVAAFFPRSLRLHRCRLPIASGRITAVTLHSF